MKIFKLLILLLLSLTITACGAVQKTQDVPIEEAPIEITIPEETVTNPPCYLTPPEKEEMAGVQTARTEAFFGEFTATSLDGEEYNESMFAQNKLTMVNIWGTFCPPCLGEMPDLGELNKEYRDKGVQIVGIVIDTLDRYLKADEKQISVAKSLVEQTKADYLHLIPSYSLIDIKLSSVSAVPETIFIDANGNVVGDSYIGSNSKEMWKDIIEEKLLEVS